MADSEELIEQLNKQTVAQLREQLAKYNLNTKGVKISLIARLVEHQMNVTDPAPKESDELEELLGGTDATDATDATDGDNKESNEQDEETIETDEVKKEEGDEAAKEDTEKNDEEDELGEDGKEVKKKDKPKPDTFIYDKDEDLYTDQEISDAEAGFSVMTKEIKEKFQMKRLCIYPVEPEDLSDSALKEILKKCYFFNVLFRCGPDGVESLEGYLDMTVLGQEELASVEQELKEWSDDITVQQGKDFDLSTLAKNNPLYAVSAPKRTICVAGIPETATESQLLALFHGFQAIIAQDKDGKANGRGYVEFATIEEALAAVEAGRAMTWEEKKLHVFRLWDMPGRDQKIINNSIEHRANALGQKRLDLVHKWESYKVDVLEPKIDEIERMEKELDEEEAQLEKDGIPAPKRWRYYIKKYLEARSKGIYVHLKHHVSLTIESLRQKLVVRSQRWKDRLERPDMHAKKVQRKSNKWEEKRMLNFKKEDKEPVKKLSDLQIDHSASGSSVKSYGAKERGYVGRQGNFAEQRAPYGGREAAYANRDATYGSTGMAYGGRDAGYGGRERAYGGRDAAYLGREAAYGGIEADFVRREADFARREASFGGDASAYGILKRNSGFADNYGRGEGHFGGSESGYDEVEPGYKRARLDMMESDYRQTNPLANRSLRASQASTLDDLISKFSWQGHR